MDSLPKPTGINENEGVRKDSSSIVKLMPKMDNLSLNDGGSWKDDTSNVSKRTRSISEASGTTTTSSVSINLEEVTSINTTGFSRGFLAGHFVGRDEVPCVPVSGVEINNHRGILSYVAKHLQTYYVKRVVSPFEFYIERESDTSSEESLRHLKMQGFYEKFENMAFEYSIQVSKTRCYAYYDQSSTKWWRVRVQDFESDFECGLNRAYVYYCDTGKQEWILCEELRQLQDDFKGAWDVAILKCYLYDVLPISEDFHWSIDAIVFFNELIANQRLGAVVMKWSRNPIVEYSPDFTFDCGVVLTEKLDPSERPDTINRIMVEMGYAKSIGIMSSSPKILDIPGIVPCFELADIREERHPANREHKGLSIEELRMIAAKAMASSGPDRNYLPLYSERPSDRPPNPENYLPFSIRCRLAWVKMSFVEGPGKIFLHSRNKQLELQAMEEEIQEVCEGLNMPKPSLQTLKSGSIILCRMFDPDYPEEVNWCRSVVMEVDISANAAKVIMVDYGNIFWAHYDLLYELPGKYFSIPSFVHRVHLRDICPNFDVNHWEKAVCTLFFKYVISHEVDSPLYFVHIAEKEDLVELTDINQELIYDKNQSRWVADHQEKPSNSVIKSMRDHPLLASHFCSRAVNIMYEVSVDESKFWKFSYLSQFLVKRNYATLVKPRLDKERIHEIIKDGFGTL